MPSTYTPADVWDATLALPSDGDTRYVASVNAALEALADQTTYLANRIPELVAR